MRVQIKNLENDRCLCSVVLESEGQQEVEVIYEVYRPSEEDFTMEVDPHFIEMRSCTRTDTREKAQLNSKTHNEVRRNVMHKLVNTKAWGIGQ